MDGIYQDYSSPPALLLAVRSHRSNATLAYEIIGPSFYLTLRERDRLEIEAKSMRTQCGNTFEKDIGSSLLLLQALTDSEADHWYGLGKGLNPFCMSLHFPENWEQDETS